MTDTRDIIVNTKPLSVPVGATAFEIKSLAIDAGIKPTQWGSGELQLREYEGSGARLLSDSDIPAGEEFGLREVDPKKYPWFWTLDGWDPATIAICPQYVVAALQGTGYRYFSGSWNDDTIGPPGFMTPHQISSAARVGLKEVYTLPGNTHYHIPNPTWVNERGEPNPYQANGRYLLPIEDALVLVEAFRKYRAYRQRRFRGGLPPEMQGLSEEELAPIHAYIAMMDDEEQAQYAPSAHGPDYVKPEPVKPTRETVARQWNIEANRVETMDEAWTRVQKEHQPLSPKDTEGLESQLTPGEDQRDNGPPVAKDRALSDKIVTPFKRQPNRFFKATGQLPEEVLRVAIRWNGLLRIRIKPEYKDQFGKYLEADVNGFPFTLRLHRSGNYYEVKLDAEEMRQITEYQVD